MAAKYTSSDFSLSGVDLSKFDMAEVHVVTDDWFYLKDCGWNPCFPNRIPADALANPEDWEIVDMIYDDLTHFCEFERKWEYMGETHYLIARLAPHEKPEFWEFEDRAAALGFKEYAA